jgi:hypothetical protein
MILRIVMRLLDCCRPSIARGRTFLVLLFAVCVVPSAANAEVVSIPFNERGFLFDTGPTLTFLWAAKEPRRTLVFIPGGEGRIGLVPDRKTLGGFYGNTLKPLSDSNLTSGQFNVVVFDSPINLAVGTDYPHSRQSREHLLRIESVVRHYKALYNLPVWVMGHSNGAVSITEFYKMLQGAGKTDLIDGAIYSSARNGARFNQATDLPVLFLAHERDGCDKSLPSESRLVYEQLRKNDPQPVSYVVIQGGEPQQLHPCSSGFHMFYGAGEEAYKAIDRFVGGTRKPVGQINPFLGITEWATTCPAWNGAFHV